MAESDYFKTNYMDALKRTTPKSSYEALGPQTSEGEADIGTTEAPKQSGYSADDKKAAGEGVKQAVGGDVGGGLMTAGAMSGQPELVAAGATMSVLSNAAKKKQAYKQALLDSLYQSQQNTNKALNNQSNNKLGMI